MENKSHALVAGFFTLVLGFCVILAFFWLGSTHETSHEYVVVTRDSVVGLNPQAQVRYRGIRVGKVTDIRLDPADRENILITISVIEDVPLTGRTIAKMGYQGVTGLSHIQLEEDDEGSEALLKPDASNPPRIAMQRSLLQSLGETGSSTLERANVLMGSANEMFNAENRRRFSASLANLEAASGSLKPTLDNLNGTLGQVRKVLDEQGVANLKEAVAEVGPLLSDTRQLLGKMQAATEKLDVAIGDPAVNGTAALMPRLNEMAVEFTQASRQLSRVLRIVEDSPQSLVFGAPVLPPGPGEPGFDQREEK